MLRGDDLATAEPWFIDYQGGRRGALQYDIASLLYDAKADIPDGIRQELLGIYLESLEEFIDVDREEFLRLFPGFVLMRALQAMGAYGYRGLHEGKEHFIASIPYGVRNILQLLNRDFPVVLPELAETFEWLAREYEVPSPQPQEMTDSRLEGPAVTNLSSPPLEVSITSFSYKKGSYPIDETEHGGGYVFDCRLLYNPGRYPEYKEKTGMDEEVITFLEGRDDVEAFWNNVVGIVDSAVAQYRKRGFDYLSVGFGCTGGQHRSVYFTERLARHLESQSPEVIIRTFHREQAEKEEDRR